MLSTRPCPVLRLSPWVIDYWEPQTTRGGCGKSCQLDVKRCQPLDNSNGLCGLPSLEFVVQRLPADPELAGRRRLVSPMACEHVVHAPSPRRAQAVLREVCRQTPPGDEVLHHVLQGADVARPVIVHELLQLPRRQVW